MKIICIIMSLLQKHIKPHCVYYILYRSIGYDTLYSNYLSIGVVSARGSYEKIRQIRRSAFAQTRNVLCALNNYLTKHKIDLAAIKIEQIDDFLAGFNARFMPATCRYNRSYLRGTTCGTGPLAGRP